MRRRKPIWVLLALADVGLIAMIAVLVLIDRMRPSAVRSAAQQSTPPPQESRDVPQEAARPKQASPLPMENGVPVARCSNFVGRFFDRGVRLEGAGNDSFLEYGFEKASVADRDFELGSPLAPQVEWDGSVTYRRPGIVERYLVRPDGVELLFVVESAPGAGDLVVQGRIRTNLDPPKDGTRGTGPLRFRRRAGGMRIDAFQIRDAVAVDALGARQTLEMSYARGRMAIHVPASWLANATYPVTIDPILSPQLIVDPSMAGTTIRSHGIAYNTTDDEYLVAWNDQATNVAAEVTAGTGGYVWGAGEDPFNTSYHDARSQTVYLASELTSAGLAAGPIHGIRLHVYQRPGQSLGSFRVRVQHTLSATSTAFVTSGWTNTYGPTTVAAASVTAGGWYSLAFNIPFYWDGTSNLLIDLSRDNTTWTAGGGLYLRSAVGSRTVAGRSDSAYAWPYDAMPVTALAYIPEIRFLQAVGGDIYAQRISSGAGLVGAVIPVDTSAFNSHECSVSWLPGVRRYLVVWRDDRDVAALGSEIYGRIFERDGTAVGAAFNISGGSTVLFDGYASVATDGANWIVFWERSWSGTDRDLYARVVTSAGGLGAPVTPDISPSDSRHPAIAFLPGSGFLCVWGDKTTLDIKARTMTASGTTLTLGAPAVVISSAGTYVRDYPEVTANTTNSEFLVAWERVYDETDRDIHLRRVSGAGAALAAEILFQDTATDHLKPHVVHNSILNEYMITYWEDSTEDDIYFHRRDGPTATTTVGTTSVYIPAAARQQLPRLAWNSKSGQYLWAWIDGDGPLNLRAAALDSQAPFDATTLSQHYPDLSGTIPTGGTIVDSPGRDLVLRANLDDLDGGAVFLEVEVRAVGVAFTNVPTAEGGPSSDLPTTARVTVDAVQGGLTPGPYHWQARTRDSTGRTSDWMSYGNNAETVADFIVIAANTVPSTPAALDQRRPDATSIAVGDGSPSPVTLVATVSDPDGGIVVLEVEVRPVGTGFTDSPTTVGADVPSGSTVNLSVSGLVAGTSYHWQARTRDSLGATSAWVSFGANPETSADFTINDRPFNSASLQQYESDGTTVIPLGANTLSTTVVFKAVVSDPAADTVKLQVEVKPSASAYDGTVAVESALLASGSTASVSVVLAAGTYKWRARTMDALGSASPWVEFNATIPHFRIIGANVAPSAPSSLAQFQGATAIATGGPLSSSPINLRALVSDPDGGVVALEVEVKNTATAFDGTVSATSGWFASGSTANVDVTVAVNGPYHWQARVKDNSGAASAWVSYPDGAPNPETSADFVRTSAPSSPGGLQQYLSDGVTVIPVADTSFAGTVVLKATVNDSDLDTVKLQVEVKPVGTAFDGTVTAESGLVASGSNASVTVAGLASAHYHWRARTMDATGAAGPWVSFPAYRRRQPITIFNISAGSPLPVGAPVELTFDHAALVSLGRSQADGDDIRVYHIAGGVTTELNRVLIRRFNTTGWNTAQCTIVFPTNVSIAPSDLDVDYWLVYDDPAAASPPANPGAVGVVVFDGFESGDLTTGGWTVSAGNMFALTNGPANSGTYWAGTVVTPFAATNSITKALSLSGLSNVYLYYARSTDDTGAGNVGFETAYTSGGEVVLETNSNAGTTAWTQSAWSIPNTATSIRLTTLFSGAQLLGNRVGYDDVRLYANHNGTLPSASLEPTVVVTTSNSESLTDFAVSLPATFGPDPYGYTAKNAAAGGLPFAWETANASRVAVNTLSPDGTATSPANAWGIFGTEPVLADGNDASYYGTSVNTLIMRANVADFALQPGETVTKVRVYVRALTVGNERIDIGLRNGATDSSVGAASSNGTGPFPITTSYVEYWEEWTAPPGGAWDLNSLQIMVTHDNVGGAGENRVAEARIEVTRDTPYYWRVIRSGATEQGTLSSARPIGFPFVFYGTEYTTFVADDDAILQFGATATGASFAIPGSGLNIIQAISKDTQAVSSNSVVRYVTLAGPTRTVIEYTEAKTVTAAEYFTVQVVLYPDGRIKVQFNRTDAPTGTSNGIDDAGALGGLNVGGWGYKGDALTFDAGFPSLSGLGQFQLDGTTPIAVGGVTSETGVVLKATLTDSSSPPDTVKLQVEVRPVGTAFTGVPTGESALVASGTEASVTLGTLGAGVFHWQARVVDSGGRPGPWTSFAANAETSTDFRLTPAGNSAPWEPTSLGQFVASYDEPAIAVGGTTGLTTIILRGTIVDGDAQTVQLQVEVQPLGTPFTGTPTATGPIMPTNSQGRVSVSGLVAGTSYHWQARTIDSASATSAWVSFGANVETAADFSVVANTPPGAPTLLAQYQSDGVTSIALGGTATATTVVFKATVSDPDGETVRLEVEPRPVDEIFLDWWGVSGFVASGTQASVTITNLAKVSYHWRVRAVDARGLAGPWASFGGNSDIPVAGTDFVVGPAGNGPPRLPIDAAQYRLDGTTPIAVGGNTPEQGVVFKATVQDPDGGDTVKLQIQVQPFGAPYSGNPTAESALVASGTVATVLLNLPAGAYRWWYRTVDNSGATTPWFSFGLNSSEDLDFAIVSMAAPTDLSQFRQDGTTPIAVGGTITGLTSVVLTGLVRDSGGLAVKLQVEVRPIATPFSGTFTDETLFFPSGSVATLTVTGLAVNSFHWQARTVNSALVASDWVAFGLNLESAADFIVATGSLLAPSGVEQRKADAVTIIPNGGSTKDATVVFRATLGGNLDQVRLEVEVIPTADTYQNVPTVASAFVAGGATATVMISGLTPATGYKWQYRAFGFFGATQTTGPWIPFNATTPNFTLGVNTTPGVPATVEQRKSNGTTVIANGGTTKETTLVFRAASITDADADTVKFQIEVVPNASAFTNTPTDESGFLSSGSVFTITKTGLVAGGYKWQYRSMDADGLASAWTAFNATTPNFTTGVNTAPAVPVTIGQRKSNGTTVILNGGTTEEATVVFRAGSITDVDGDTVKFQIEVVPNASAFTNTPTDESGFQASGTVFTISKGGLVGAYKWQYRSIDVDGLTSAWTVFNAATPNFTASTSTPPAVPTSLLQWKPDGLSSVAVGGVLNETSIIFEATLGADPEGQQTRLEVEFQPIGTVFVGVGQVRTGLVSGGTKVRVLGPGLNGASYHWQARTVDSGGLASAWVSFGGNLDPGDTDFRVNLAGVPTALTQLKLDAVTVIAPGAVTNERAVILRAMVNDPGAETVKLQVELVPFGVAFTGSPTAESALVAAASTVSLTVGGIAGVPYHWRARCVDSLGAASDWIEFGAGSATGGGISANSGSSEEPSVVLDVTGNPVIAWPDDTSGNYEIYLRRWNGSAWVELAGSATGGGVSSTSGVSSSPWLALDALGNPVVAWADNTSGNYETYIKRWNGSAWVELAGSATGGGISSNAGNSQYPSLAIAASGNPVVVWDQFTSGTNYEIYVKLWDGTAWVELAGSATGGGISANAGESHVPVLALDGVGNPAVAWQDWTSGNYEIYVRRWNGTSWVELAGSATGGGISANAGESYGAAIVIDPSANPMVAWYDNTSLNYEVYLKQWNGTAWVEIAGSATGGGISANSGGSFNGRRSLDLDPLHNPVLGYKDNTSGNYEIYVKKWDGAKWTEVGTGSASGGGISANTGISNAPWLGRDAGGTPVFAWSDDTNTNNEVYARRFTGTAWVEYVPDSSADFDVDVPVGAVIANFDSGFPTGWRIDLGTAVNWAVDNTPITVPGGPTAFGSAGSLNYNDGVDIDDGAANRGIATSPAVDTGTSGDWRIEFRCMYATETTGTTYDRRFLEVSGDGFQTILRSIQYSGALCGGTNVWHQHIIYVPATFSGIVDSSTTTTIVDAAIPAPPDGTYVGWRVTVGGETRFVSAWDGGTSTLTLAAPLPAAPAPGTPFTLGWGTINVRYRFDTVDAQKNDLSNQGWFIDEFAVHSRPEPPSSLLTEGLVNPAGVLDGSPDFTATHTDADLTTANWYRVQVSTDSTFITVTHWDSGLTAISPVSSGSSASIIYGGTALSWNATYFWRILFRDQYLLDSDWSATAQFTMATPTTTLPNSGLGNAGWNLLVMPSGVSVPAAQLFDDMALWWVFEWDEVARNYVAVPSGGTLLAGKTYFVWTQNPATVDLLAGTARKGNFKISTSGADVAFGTAVDASGLYVVGYDSAFATVNDLQWRIEKRSPGAGTLDPAFGTGGVVQSNPSSLHDMAHAAAVDGTGLYVVGFSNFVGNPDWRMEKRNLATGASIWNQNASFSAGDDVAHGVAVDGTGVYVVGSDSSPGNLQWRIEKRSLADGSVIWSQVSNPSGGADVAFAVAVDATGVYIVGYDSSTGNPQWRVEKRDLTTGAPVVAFGGSGSISTDPSAGNDAATAVAVDGTGLTVAGYDSVPGNRQWRIQRINFTDGTLSWTQVSNPSANADEPRAVSVDASGIYVAGFDVSAGSYQWRIEKRQISDGALMAAFDADGILTNDTSTGNDSAHALAIDAGGLYIVGHDTSGNTTEWRMEKRDPTAGTLTWSQTSNPNVNAIAPDSNASFPLTFVTTGVTNAPYETSPDQYRGWHLVGQPFNNPVSWQTGVSRTNVDATCWYWDGSVQDYRGWNAGTNTPVNGGVAAMDPWGGRWILVSSDTNSITFNDPTASSITDPPPPPFTANWWLLQVTADSAGARDHGNYAGVHPGASDDWDERDARDPGTLADPYVLAFFPHDTWADPRNGTYAMDVRKTAFTQGSTVSWTLRVKTNTGAWVALKWPNLTDLPANWSLTITDTVTGITTALAPGGEVGFDPGPGVVTRDFLITATRNDNAVGILEVLPGEFVPDGSLPPGTTGVKMLEFTAKAYLEDIAISQIVLHGEGTGDEPPCIDSVFLVRDVNGNSQYDPGLDVIEGTLAYASDDGTLAFNVNVTIPQGQTVRWFVNYSYSAVAGGTFRCRINPTEITATGTFTAMPSSITGSVLTGGTKSVGSSGGGGGGGGCGMVGLDALILLALIGLIRRRR